MPRKVTNRKAAAAAVKEPSPSPSTSSSSSAAHSYSRQQETEEEADNSNKAIVAHCGQFKLTRSDQVFAAVFMLSLSSLGCVALLYSYWKFIISNNLFADSWDLLCWPMTAYGGAVLLWHKYEFGIRRNIDIVVICSAIFAATFNMATRCTKNDFLWYVYLAVWTVGSAAFVGGWAVRQWRWACCLHLFCHFTGYACNILVFACVAASSSS